MNSFFSLEGPFISFLDKCGRIVILTLLWLLCSVPIVTVAASSSAFYYGMVKTVRRDRSSTVREFFRCFKRLLKKGALSSVVSVVLCLVLILDIIVWYKKATVFSILNMSLCAVLLVLYIAYLCFCFAALSRFLYPVKELIRFSAFLTFKHLPVTLILAAVSAAMFFAVLLFPLSAVFVPGMACMGISYFIENVFKKYMPKPEAGKEVWYDE